MNSNINGLQVTFTDAKQLMKYAIGIAVKPQQRDLLDYGKSDVYQLPPRHLICLHGIFVDVHLIKGKALTDDEMQVFLDCTSGDPYKPCVVFPCTLKDLKDFLENEHATELIDPFDLAEWVMRKNPSPSSESETDDIRIMEAMGLLVEVYASSRDFNYRHKSSDRPNASAIVRDMMNRVPEHVTKMGSRKQKKILSDAIDAWQEKLESIIDAAEDAWDAKKAR